MITTAGGFLVWARDRWLTAGLLAIALIAFFLAVKFRHTPTLEDRFAGESPGIAAMLDEEPSSLLVQAGVVALALLPVIYLSTLCHEAGHAVMAWCVGYVVLSFGLGLGRPFLVWRLGRTRFFLGRTKPLQGITFTMAPGRPPARWRQVVNLAGGVLGNTLLALAALSLLALVPAGKCVWWTILLFNAAAVVLNLVPVTPRLGSLSVRNDGGQILRALRGRAVALPQPLLIEQVLALQGLWKDIGDDANLYYHRMVSAAAWEELGDVEHAEKLCGEAEALPRPSWPILRAWGALVHGIIAARTGQFAASAKALDEAEAAYRQLGHDPGLFLVSWVRAKLLREQGDAAAALHSLDSLAASPLQAAVREAGALGVLASRLRLRAELDDLAGAEALRAEYESAPRRLFALARNLSVYQALARLHGRRGDWAGADAAYRKALHSAGKLYSLFTTPSEQARFARVQAPLLTEARECLEQLGKGMEDQHLRDVFPNTEEIERRRGMELQKRATRQRRLALVLVLFNTIVLLGLVAIVHFRPTGPLTVEVQPGVRFPARRATTPTEYLLQLPIRAGAHFGPAGAMLLICLALWTTLALVVLPVAFLAGPLMPASRNGGGKWFLFLALLPWLSWIGCYLLTPLRPLR
jgi:tetratricopeptide (TPR) repeat protein